MFNKKSHINILETIVVLAIFFILVFFMFIFYSKISENSLEIENEQNSELDAIKIAQRASFLPELQCSQDNVIEDNCIDLHKLAALIDVINENEIHYFDLFKFSRITVNEVYPNDGQIIVYDRPLDEYSYKNVINNPVLLFDSLNNKNNFGIMVVEVYSK